MQYETNQFKFHMPQFDNGVEANETVYSDRIWQQDNKKHDELCMKHFGDTGQGWFRHPDKIEAFLTDFLGRKVQLCRIEEMENASTKYPYWRFDFNFVKE